MSLESEFRVTFEPCGLATFDRAAVNRLGLNSADARWLVEVGLPKSAAPFVGFGGVEESYLPTVTAMWGLRRNLDQFLLIGENGGGDPIAIDVNSAFEIVYLNHDDDFKRVFINSSICHLAISLLGFRQMVDRSLAAIGHGAFLDRKAPSAALQAFRTMVEASDPRALAPGTMWHQEIADVEEL